MIAHRFHLMIALAVAAACGSARADIIYFNAAEHSDVEVAYDQGTGRLGLELHFDDLGVHFDTSEVMTVIGRNGRSVVPPSYSFLGLPAGASYWSIPQNPEPGRPILGVGAAEDADESPDGFFSNPLRLSVLGVRGPGDVAVLRDTFGGPVVFANSADGLDDQDVIDVLTSGHQDYQWAFTRPGMYQVDVQVSGTRTTGGVETSDVYTLFFAVDLQAVPEPATLVTFALLTGGGLAVARRRFARGI